MNRTGKIITARVLRRHLWKSLPFGKRVAIVMTRLASATTDAWGQTMMGIFLLHKVEGLPDINGRPALEYPTDRSSLNRLPKGYGREFGQYAFRMMMQKVHNPQMVEDLMLTFLDRFLAGSHKHMEDNITLNKARGYVFSSLNNEWLSYLRKKKELQLKSPTNDDSDEEESFEPADHGAKDPDDAARLLRLLPATVVRKLESVYPDAMKYLQLSIVEGYDDSEIFNPQHPLVHAFTENGTPLNNKNWNVLLKGKIFEVLKRNLDADALRAMV